jgi:hypothetical protein
MENGLFYSKYDLSEPVLPITPNRRYYIMFKDDIDGITSISLAKLNTKQVENLKLSLCVAKQPISIMLDEELEIWYTSKELLSKLHILEMIPNRPMDKCIEETFGVDIEPYLKNIAKGIYN